MEFPGRAEPQLGIDWASKSWKSRGYLPHYDSQGCFQSITFRLADSLPQKLLKRLEEDLQEVSADRKDIHKRLSIEKWLDAGYGCCALGNPQVAQVMQDTLIKFHGVKYELVAWCIMPNHVHVLINTMESLGKVVQSWKSYVGKWALANNENLSLAIPSANDAEQGLGAPRMFWMREYWDRYIRDESHFNNTVNYIHENPVKAGLCSIPSEWQWSSARQ